MPACINWVSQCLLAWIYTHTKQSDCDSCLFSILNLFCHSNVCIQSVSPPHPPLSFLLFLSLMILLPFPCCLSHMLAILLSCSSLCSHPCPSLSLPFLLFTNLPAQVSHLLFLPFLLIDSLVFIFHFCPFL